MDIRTALSVAGMCAMVSVFAGWRGARPPNPMKGPRMVPWRFVMVLAATGALLFGISAAHMALGR